MTKKKKTSKKKSKAKSKESSRLSSLFKWLWLAVICGLIFTLALFVLISFSKLPDTGELENPKFEQSTIAYSDTKEEIGRIFNKNRDWTTFEDLSPHVVNALIATEDERFYDHAGVDFRGFMRAVFFMGRRGGASTITQQLAKQFFTKRSRNFVRRAFQKLKEWVIAIEFEKRYTKGEIIAMLLNKYDFLYDSNGIAAASKTYFGKSHKKLKIEEAAILIGMLKNPRIYNPVLYPDNANKRREVVLSQMKKNNHITQSEYDSLRTLPIDISNFSRSSHNKGPAPYFMASLKEWVGDLLNEDKYLKPDGTTYDIYQDGLKIYTTINIPMQIHAEAAMKTHMSKLQDKFFDRWKGLDPWTYDADEKQKSIRLNRLKTMIDRSDRYRKLRAKHLTKMVSSLSQNIEGVRLYDGDIKRMLTAKKDPNYLDELVRDKIISKKIKARYVSIMEHEKWSDLRQSWDRLNAEKKKAFQQKVKMKVFAYTPSGEKETTMSPLDSIKYHAMHMQLGSIAMDPKNGHIKTWVGGIGFKYFQYDHINSNRQVGSTFKPFVYTTAIRQGRSPCWKIKDIPYTIDKDDPNFDIDKTWEPHNSGKKYTGEDMTLYKCLEKSLNSASVWLMKQIGSVAAVKNLAVNMGIPAKKIPNYPSICLGTPELSVMDLTSAYGAFANNGVYSKPEFVTRIEDSKGRLIYTASPSQKKVLETNYNYVMVDMLDKAVTNHKSKLQTNFGGKTGTTDNHADGWFMGIMPNLVVGTWVGGEDMWIRFNNIADGSGGAMARPYFVEFIKRVENDSQIPWDKDAQFIRPEGDLGIEINCELYEQLYQNQKKPIEEEIENEFEDDFDE